MKRNWAAGVAGIALLVGAPQAAAQQAYRTCLGEPEPLGCIVRRAQAEAEGEPRTLIAAGAVDEAGASSPFRERREAGLAARIARGERPAMSVRDAQRVLAVFSEVEFYDTGLPEDERAEWLWPIALVEPIADLDLRERLIHAASRADRDEDVRALIRGAPLHRRWTRDQRASFASLAARVGKDWRTAEAWLASGGNGADGYLVPSIQVAIDRARLLEGYEALAAARVADAMIESDEMGLFFEEDVEALKAAGAVAEMRAAAAALVDRGQRPGRRSADRSEDFGVASMLFQAAGDREAALNAAREGALLAPAGVADWLSGRGDAAGMTAAQRAQMALGSITLPVRQLYRLGARDEALANGYLAGRDRYLAELDAGRKPDPNWITAPRIDFELKLIVPGLVARDARSEASQLLARLKADSAAWEEAGAGELMMLAAIAGDPLALDAIFEGAVGRLDDEDAGGWSALQLVIGRRTADAALGRAQSP